MEETLGGYLLSAWTDQISVDSIQQWGCHILDFDFQSGVFRKPEQKPSKVKSLEDMDRDRASILMFISKSADDECSSEMFQKLLEMLFPISCHDYFDKLGNQAKITKCPASGDEIDCVVKRNGFNDVKTPLVGCNGSIF